MFTRLCDYLSGEEEHHPKKKRLVDAGKAWDGIQDAVRSKIGYPELELEMD